MVRIHPHPPGRGSSVVEQRSEEPRVVSSILTLGTTKFSQLRLWEFCFGQERTDVQFDGQVSERSPRLT